MSFITDLRFAWRSLARVKGLTFTVVVTLALGIGANAAMFSMVRGVLLRPLVNRDEDRLIYIRQSAPGLGEPRTVRAGVVGGSYFEVMGLKPVRGRLLGPADDGPKARGGTLDVVQPWRPDDSDLSPINYRCRVQLPRTV